MLRYLIFILLALCTQHVFSQSQFRIGILAGANTIDIDPKEIDITNPDENESLRVALNKAEYGIHFGLFFQLRGKHLFLQPQFIFNSNSTNYKVSQFEDGEWVSEIKEEKYQYLDIPVLMGLRLGPIRIGGGPVAHLFIDSSPFKLESYDQKFKTATFGYQAGIGIDLGSLHLDLDYEGNFYKYGDHFRFFGEEYEFDQSPARWIGTLGITF